MGERVGRRSVAPPFAGAATDPQKSDILYIRPRRFNQRIVRTPLSAGSRMPNARKATGLARIAFIQLKFIPKKPVTKARK